MVVRRMNCGERSLDKIHNKKCEEKVFCNFDLAKDSCFVGYDRKDSRDATCRKIGNHALKGNRRVQGFKVPGGNVFVQISCPVIYYNMIKI